MSSPTPQDDPTVPTKAPGAAPTEPAAEPAAAEPAAAEVVRAAEVVDPATVRRAPRFRAFAATGVLTGLVVGVVTGLIVFRDAPNRGFAVTVLTVDVTIVTVLVAVIWAIVADRRSRTR